MLNLKNLGDKLHPSYFQAIQPTLIIDSQLLVAEGWDEYELSHHIGNDQFYWSLLYNYNGNTYRLKITYSFGFPYIQPEVRVWKLMNGKYVKEVFSETNHVYQDNILCLYTWDDGSESWKENYNIIHVLDKFESFLISLENQSHELQFHYSNDSTWLFADRLILLKLNSLQLKPLFKIRLIAEVNEINNIIIIKKIKISHRNKTKIIKLEQKYPFNNISSFQEITLKGRVLPPKQFEEIKTVKSTLRLNERFKRIAGEWNHRSETPYLVFNQTINNIQNDVYAIIADNITNRIRRIKIIEEFHNNYLFTRSGLKGVDTAFFQKFIVILIGAGSLGGELAIKLCKTGFVNFMLIDPDIFEIDNISRHILNMDSMYKFKVDALGDLMMQINSHLSIEILVESVFYPSVIKKLMSLNNSKLIPLIISTVANDKVNYFLNQIAIINNYNMIFAYCFASVDTSRIFWMTGNDTACYNCLQLYEDNKHLSTPDDYQGGKPPYTEGIPGLILDTSIVSVNLAQTIFQVALSLEKYDSKYRRKIRNVVTISRLDHDSNFLNIYDQQVEKHPNCKICRVD